MQIKELPKMEVLQQCPYRRGKWIKCAPAIVICFSPAHGITCMAAVVQAYLQWEVQM